MSRFAKGRKLIERHQFTYPHHAAACASIAEMTGARFGQCVSAVTDRGVRTFAFRKRSAMVLFVRDTESAREV